MAANYTIFTKFAAIDAMSSTLNKIQGRVAAMTTSLNKAQTSTGNVLKGLGDQAIMRGIGLAAIGSGILLKNAIQTAAEFESIKTAISFASGNEAANNLQFLDDTVKNLKIDYLVTAESFKRFLGSMKSTTIAAEAQRDIFNKMATTVRVMALSAEGQERVFYALGEMYSKGQVMSQELKQQIGNALPGAVDAFAKSMGKPQKEFRKLMEAGNVSNEEIKGFVDYIYNVYAPGLENATKTASAQLTDLSNTWQRIQETLGGAIISSGVIDYIQGVMDGVLSWANANRELLKSGFISFLDAVKSTFQWIYNNWDAIVVGLKVWLGAWAVMKVINTWLTLMTTSLKTIELLMGPAGWIITGVALLAGWLLEAYNTGAKLEEGTRRFGKNLYDAKDNVSGMTNEMKKLNKELTLSQQIDADYAEDWNRFIVSILEGVRAITNALSYLPGNAGLYAQAGSDELGKMILERKRGINERLGNVRTPIDQTSEVATRTQKYLMTQESTDYNRGWGVTLPQTQSGTPEYAPGSKSYGDLIPATSYLSQSNREGVLEILIKSDKDTTAEVVKSSGAMPVSVTINNK